MFKKIISIFLVFMLTFVLIFDTAEGSNNVEAKKPPLIPAGETGNIKWSQSFSLASDFMNSIAYSGNKYVAVGYSGAIWTSSNGENWKVIPLDFYKSLYSVIWDGSRFVACGDNGTIGISSNGETWKFKNVDGVINVKDIVYAQNKYVAVGKGGILTSVDRQTWTKKYNKYAYLSSVTYGANKFIAIGGNYIAISRDGVNWKYITKSGIGQLSKIIWNGKIFIASSEEAIMTSSDGLIWKDRFPMKYAVRGFVMNYIKILAVGYCGNVLESVDGVKWESHVINQGYGLESVIWDGKRFIAVGNTILASDSGQKWTDLMPNRMEYNESICYDGKKYVSLGFTQATSSDGIQWNSLKKYSSGSIPYASIISTGEMFVAVGVRGISVSYDGENWNNVFYSNWCILAIAWNGTDYVAVGAESKVLTSPDGLVWTENSIDTGNNPLDVIWDGSNFIAVGSKGTIISSNDGKTWSKIPFTANTHIGSIAWNGSMYVLSCFDEKAGGFIYVSKDLKSWKVSLKGAIDYPAKLKWLNGQFFLLTGRIIVSKDGNTWNESIMKTGKRISDVIWDGSKYIAIGDMGLILIGFKKNTESVITSAIYNVDEKKRTITGISSKTNLNSFLKNIVLSSGATVIIYNNNHAVTTDRIGNQMKLEVTSEDKSSKRTYILYVDNK